MTLVLEFQYTKYIKKQQQKNFSNCIVKLCCHLIILRLGSQLQPWLYPGQLHPSPPPPWVPPPPPAKPLHLEMMTLSASPSLSRPPALSLWSPTLCISVNNQSINPDFNQHNQTPLTVGLIDAAFVTSLNVEHEQRRMFIYTKVLYLNTAKNSGPSSSHVSEASLSNIPFSNLFRNVPCKNKSGIH